MTPSVTPSACFCSLPSPLPAAAQTTLGTIRGTVFDPQQHVVPGATVVVTDESTNVAREAQTDAQGLFEIPNLRPGTYTVTATLSGFKKAQRTGVVLRAASVVRTDLQPRGRRPRRRRDGDGRAARTTSRSRARRSRAASTSSSCAICRATAATSRTSSRSTRTSSAASTASSFSAAAPTARRTSRTASRRAPGSSASSPMPRPGLDAIQEVQVLSNSYSAEYGGLAGVIVSTKRGANRYRGDRVLRLQLERAERPHLRAGAERRVARATPTPTRTTIGTACSLGGPIVTNRTFFFGNYEGSKLKALGGGSQAIVPTAAMRNGDFSANTFVVRDPLTGVQFPGNRIPADRIDPSARRILDFFYPLPNQANLAAGGYGAFREILPLNRERDRADVRVDHELTGRDSLFARVSWQRRDPDAFTFESTGGNGGAGLTNLGLLDRKSKAITLAGGWTRIWSGTLVSEFRGGYSSGHAQSKEPFRRRRLWRLSSGSRCRRWPPRCPGFPSFLFSGDEPAVRHSRPAAERLPGSRSVVVLDQQQLDVAEGQALDQVRRHLHAATTRRTATPPARTSRRARTPSRGLRRETRSPTSCSVCRTRCASSAIPAATCRWTRSRTTGPCSRRTTSS